MIDFALSCPAPVPQVQITQMRVIAKERTRRSRRPNENAQPVAPARQIRPGMRRREENHFSDALDEAQSFGVVRCRIRRLSQELLDDKTAETVPDQNQLARPKVGIHQQLIEHIGRTVGQFHRRAVPARHGRLIAHGVNRQAFDVLSQPSRPERGLVWASTPRGLSVAAEAVEENHVGALLPLCFGDREKLCHLRPRRGLTDRCPPRPKRRHWRLHRGFSASNQGHHTAVHLMAASVASGRPCQGCHRVFGRTPVACNGGASILASPVYRTC